MRLWRCLTRVEVDLAQVLKTSMPPQCVRSSPRDRRSRKKTIRGYHQAPNRAHYPAHHRAQSSAPSSHRSILGARLTASNLAARHQKPETDSRTEPGQVEAKAPLPPNAPHCGSPPRPRAKVHASLPPRSRPISPNRHPKRSLAYPSPRCPPHASVSCKKNSATIPSAYSSPSSS